MLNINKYWLLLESLQFPAMGDSMSMQSSLNRLENNAKELQKFININGNDLVEHLIDKWNLNHLKSASFSQNVLCPEDVPTLYCLYGLYFINEVKQQVNFQSTAKEELVSERHKTLVIACLQDIGRWGLEQNLYKDFYQTKNAVFKKDTTVPTNPSILDILIQGFAPIVCLQSLHIGKALHGVVLQYMAGLFSLLVAHECKEYTMPTEQFITINSHLLNVWCSLPKTLFLRNVMIIKSNNSLGEMAQKILQRQLLLRLWSPGGFQALMFALIEAKRSEEEDVGELIARLVAQPAYSVKAQESLLKQILTFVRASVTNRELLCFMGVALLALRRLYDLNDENRTYVKVWLAALFQPLTQPQEDALEIIEWQEFQRLISTLFHMFCTSSIECLPSDLLTPYLVLLLNILHFISGRGHVVLEEHLTSIIIRCLNNRTDSELEAIVQNLIAEEYPAGWQQLNENILFQENALNCQELRIVFSPHSKEAWEPVMILVKALRNSSFNLLTFKVFLIMFRSLSYVTEQESSVSVNHDLLLYTEEDICRTLEKGINQKYGRNLQIVRALEMMVQHPPLKPLINENLKDLLQCLVCAINSFTNASDKNSSTDDDSSIIMITLVLIREIMESSFYNVEEFRAALEPPLKKLYATLAEVNLKFQIYALLQLLQRDSSCDLDSNYEPMRDTFENSRSLVESQESYLQVEGIEKFIKLINSRDEYAVNNSHIITALALNQLKSPESYTFLNCVRLFVALVHVMESEILQILSDEYLSDVASMDYRLVVGEAILKVSRELGPLCFKYKAVLLNCYMNGCRSTLNEFRFSSFSNLGQMCKILTYQVHHYFQELLHVIDCELTTGQYLPAKRASVMVLSDLLEGMDNLLDYEEMLLPIYRLLKHLASSSVIDDKIRMHASNGLSCLSEKCVQLIKSISNPPVEKAITILSTKQAHKPGHVLELN